MKNAFAMINQNASTQMKMELNDIKAESIQLGNGENEPYLATNRVEN
jgi:hypothetical protein